MYECESEDDEEEEEEDEENAIVAETKLKGTE